VYVQTTATERIAKLTKRIKAVAGGTSASKTISILLVLIDKLQSLDNKLYSVVSESLPHLKKGAERDFLDIMNKHGYYQESRWNRTDHIYTFETGSKLEFFGVDQADKVRGPRRDGLFMNEANNCPYDSFDQLEVRTKDEIFLDWNPTHEFWFYTEIKRQREKDIDFITLTYKDNQALDPQIVESIESRKENKRWWTVYGEGQLGEYEGRIFTDWQIIDEVPHEAKLERYGLDFGYSVDPTAIIAIYKYNGGYIFDEIVYQKGMLNKQIADAIKNYPQALVVADSAEPKSIDELKMHGVMIIPSVKGPGSISAGINQVQACRCSITKTSTNLIKEYRNYSWKVDKDGKSLQVPEPGDDHGLDAIRYGISSLNIVDEYTIKTPVMPQIFTKEGFY
jgi:phage terminase large subunit